jgi:hypothetical protein
MRKYFFYGLCSTIILSILAGCNDQNKMPVVEEENTARAAPITDYCTVGNFLILPGEADRMIKRFKKEFNDDFPASKDLTDSFWVDKCVIYQFHDFLSKNSGYDGIRIYSIATAKKSNIWIVPTFDSPNHVDAWGNLLPAIQNCDNIEFSNYNKDKSIGEPLINEFGHEFREEQKEGEVNSARNDSLSKGVWFGKCVIDSLFKYLSNISLGLDGVRIHCGSYDKKDIRRGQHKAIQNTFIFVVSKPDGHGGHRSDWNVLVNVYKNKYKLNERIFEGGYNHGELCPKICD